MSQLLSLYVRPACVGGAQLIMKNYRKIILIIAACLLPLSAATMLDFNQLSRNWLKPIEGPIMSQEFYVSGDYGNSGETGTSWENAIDTIEEALSVSTRDDIIIIDADAGAYDEELTISNRTIRAASRTDATADVTFTAPLTLNGVTLDVSANNHIVFQADVVISGASSFSNNEQYSGSNNLAYGTNNETYAE